MNHGQRRSGSRGGDVGDPPLAPASVGRSTGAATNSAVSRGAATPDAIWSRAVLSAAANSSALCQRCAGSLARAAMTTDSSVGCTSGRSCEIGVGGSERCLSATATALSPWKGTRPVSSS